ncbi:MAG: hypothetical protein ACOVOQ_06095 [Flavobacterium sp.]
MKLLYLLSLLIITSCQKKLKQNDFEIVINKYDKTDFSFFKNTFIAIRERSRSEIIFIIGKSEDNLPVYFVNYSINKDRIIEINKRALKEKNIEDYFSDNEINKLIVNFKKLDLSLLKVDKDGNVFINPFDINEPAVMLRLENLSNKKEIRKGFVYSQYKNNWYIKK